MSELLITKDFNTIVDDSIETARAIQTLITDYNIGSVFRSLLEVYALELDDLYRIMTQDITIAIPTSIYTAFDFGILAAVPATGNVTLTLNETKTIDYLIEKGTKVSQSNSLITYSTDADHTIMAGETSIVVRVVCDTVGTVGNCLSDTITQCTDANLSVNNNLPFISGRDLESDLDRKLRFRSYVLSFARATVASLEYAAKLAQLVDTNGYVTEYITGVGISETYPGQVDIYLSTGTTDPSDEIMTLAQKYIDGWTDADGTKHAGYRAAGVKVILHRVSYLPVEFAIRIIPRAGIYYQSITNAVLTALDRLLSSVNPGDTFYLSSAISAMSSVSGVAGIHILSPTDDIDVPFDSALVRSTTTVSD